MSPLAAAAVSEHPTLLLLGGADAITVGAALGLLRGEEFGVVADALGSLPAPSQNEIAVREVMGAGVVLEMLGEYRVGGPPLGLGCMRTLAGTDPALATVAPNRRVLGAIGMALRAMGLGPVARRDGEPASAEVIPAGGWSEMDRIDASAVQARRAAHTTGVPVVAFVVDVHSLRDRSDEVLIGNAMGSDLLAIDNHNAVPGGHRSRPEPATGRELYGALPTIQGSVIHEMDRSTILYS